jgi:hypothetical protein
MAPERLDAGECLLKLTKSEREILHLVLAVALEQPSLFGAYPDGDRAVAAVFAATVARIQKKLPRRGAGTY